MTEPAPPDRGGADSQDVSHAARSGAVQTLTYAAQALLTVTHVLLARLFGAAVFGSYQTCLAIVEMLTPLVRAGQIRGCSATSPRIARAARQTWCAVRWAPACV